MAAPTAFVTRGCWILHFQHLTRVLENMNFTHPLPRKRVRLCFGLVKNHPFFDGNKRIGTMALLITLEQNHLKFTASSFELTEVILDLASGNRSYEDLLQWGRDRIE